MACYSPIDAYRSKAGRDPTTGKWPIVFRLSEGYSDFPLKIPCGQCIGCRLERSRQWATRCVHEAELWPSNCFITLTYAPEFLPRGINPDTGEIDAGAPSLNKRDVVLFLKRLRKKFGDGIRFFQCGEYGDKGGRPHHHMILFNFDFPDREFFSANRGYPLFTSKILSELWPFGLCSVADVTFESAAYVARYVTKKITGVLAHDHYNGRLPEYITMSRRPGIARYWIDQFASDVYNQDECKVRIGVKTRPPRYYDNIYDLTNPVRMGIIRRRRVKKALANSDNNTVARLMVREHIARIKHSKLLRSLERESV